MKTLSERCAALTVCLLVGWFYVWTAASSDGLAARVGPKRDYYNLLLDGWLEGHLHMKVAVPEALLRLSDPYDPAVRPPGLGLHDASFHRGRYYLYFGAAPVVTLLLPYRLVTGSDLSEAAAVLLFGFAGFLVAFALWWSVRGRYFPDTGPLVTLLAGGVLGLASLGPVLLRRPHLWELPIAAGSCFALLALFALWRALHAAPSAGPGLVPRARAGWAAGAGLGLGLAIASRPTYLIASPFLVVPFLVWWRRERRLPWPEAAAALAPLALIGLAMAWHNQARFGDPLQFGQAYQFSMDYESRMAHFRAGHAPFNLWRYFLSPASWSWEFPFIRPADLPPKPPGFGGHDDAFGLLVNLPVAWLALAAPFALWRRDAAARSRLAAWLGAAAVLFAAMAGTLVLFFGSLARYQSDFTPPLMLLAAVGILVLERWLREGRCRQLRWPVRLAWGGVAVFSCGFALLASIQLNGFLLQRNPDAYRQVETRLNGVAGLLERVLGRRHGPLEMDVWIRPEMPGTRHRLVTAGHGPTVDRLEVVHEAEGRVVFEVTSAGGLTFRSLPVRPDPDSPQRLRLSIGSLLPPPNHALWGPATGEERLAARHALTLDLAGTRLIEAFPWFAAAPGPVTIGVYAAEEGPLRFSGAATAMTRDEPGLPALARAAGDHVRREQSRWSPDGTVRLRLRLPPVGAGLMHPLVVTGEPGHGDMIGLQHESPGRIRVGWDHWGSSRGRRSATVEVDPGVAHDVALTLVAPVFVPGAGERVTGRLQVVVDGRLVWEESGEFFNVPPWQRAVGRNPIGGTSCSAAFGGPLFEVLPAGP